VLTAPSLPLSPKKGSGSRVDGTTPTSSPPGAHWSQVEKQQLPVESSKKILSLIEQDNISPENSQVQTLQL